VVAPPLKVLLPKLYHNIYNYIAATTPRRGQDWFAIVQSTISQAIHVISQTDAGRALVERLQAWWYSMVTCLTSASTRQVLIDGTAWHVFFYRLLATPECQAVLQQTVTCWCRLIDALYLHKQVVTDSATLVSSWLTLLNDGTTTAALAEVMARLCLALEMEQAAQQQQQQQQQQKQQQPNRRSNSSISKEGGGGGGGGRRRRAERNAHQTAIYQNPVLMTQPDATVEDVILSSLGYGCGCTDNDVDDASTDDNADDDDDYSLSSSTTAPPLPCTDKNNEDDEARRKSMDKDNNDENENDLRAKPVNVDYLRQHIMATTDHQQHQQQEQQQLQSATCAEKKQTAAGSHDDDDDDDQYIDCVEEHHDEKEEAAEDDMEDLNLAAKATTVISTPPYGREDQQGKSHTLLLPPRKRNRTFLQASAGSNKNNKDSPVLPGEHDLDDGDDFVGNDNDYGNHTVQHQSSTTTPLQLPVQQQQPLSLRQQQLDGESSLSYFYRVLDQVLENERKNGVDHLWAKSGTDSTHMPQPPPRGRVRRRPKTTVGSSIDDHGWPMPTTATTTITMSSVWGQFKHAWEEAAAAREQQDLQSNTRTTSHATASNTQRRFPKLVIVGLLMTSVLCFLTFSAFGCYGVYVFFVGHPRSVTTTTFSKVSRHRQLQQQQQNDDEVVIRIIRQVVHVDAATGHVLKSHDDSSSGCSDVSSHSLLKEPHVMDKISECVAKVIDK
jgi:hypothetical protein